MFGNLPLHPATVHLPIGIMAILPIMTLLLGGLFALKLLDNKSLIAIVLLHGLLVGTSYLALETGEKEEHKAEKVVGERWVEAHEDKAEVFVGGAILVAVLSLIILLPMNRQWVTYSLILLFVGQLVLVGLGYQVGHSGGELVYIHGAGQINN